MSKRKCFICRRFGHIVQHCRNRRESEENRKAKVGKPEHQPLSNRFEVLTSRVMQVEISKKRPDSCSISIEEKKKKSC